MLLTTENIILIGALLLLVSVFAFLITCAGIDFVRDRIDRRVRYLCEELFEIVK